MTRFKTDERGQAVVFLVIAMTALLGMTALVLDVGSWFRADRQLQQVADSAALAAAQALPEDPGTASALAAEYAAKNDGPALDGIEFKQTVVPNDTIRLAVSRPAPGFFSKLFGVDSVQVNANASARSSNISAARWVAPVVVDIDHPMLNCGSVSGKPKPCFGEPTELDLLHLKEDGGGGKGGGGGGGGDGSSSDAAGAFGLLNLRFGDKTGSVGAEELGEWMGRGYDAMMPLGVYYSVPSTMFNSSHFQDALTAVVGQDVLFPIYRTIKQSGSNAEYDIVGWVGFTPTGSQVKGNDGKIFGSFTRVIWEGLQDETGSQPDFGVRAIALVE
jgi:hypothetical protein